MYVSCESRDNYSSKFPSFVDRQNLLGGSWVVISGGISRVTILITHIGGLVAHDIWDL